MQHDLLFRRGSWMWFQDRSYRTLAPCPMNNRVLEDLTQQGTTAFVPDSSVHPESFHPLYPGDTGITLSRAPTCRCRFVSQKRCPCQRRLLPGPRAARGFCFFCGRTHQGKWPPAHPTSRHRGSRPSCLARHLLWAVLSDNPAPCLRPHDTDAHHFSVPGPVSTHSMDVDPPSPPQCLDPFVYAAQQPRHAKTPWPLRLRLPTAPVHLPCSSD